MAARPGGRPRWARVIAIGLLGALAMVAPSIPAGAQAPAGGGAESHVLLSADQLAYDQELGVITASGNVELSRGDYLLRADTVSYNRRADMVTASGNVALLDPTGVAMFSDYVELSDDLKSGVIEGIRILLSDNSRMAANGARLTSDGRTDMSKAVYSPCNLCAKHRDRAPLWQIKAVRVIHDKKLHRIFYNDVFLEVFGIPVAYVPFFSHPDPTVVRKTGFLPPTFGTDSVLGATYKQPYFFDISPSQDATLAPIVTSDEGTVLTGEYREVTEHGNYRFNGSVTRADRTPQDPKLTERTRGHVFAKGDFTINPRWRGGFDINRASDATYLGRYGFARGDDQLTTDIFVEGARGRNFATLRGLSFQSLDPDVDESTVPYVVPFADYAYRSEPTARGDYWLIDGNLRVLGRSDGADSRRLSLTGAWRVPFTGNLGDVYALTVSLRGDLYHVTNLADPQGPAGRSLRGLTGRVVPQAELDWRYPFVRSAGDSSQIIEPIAQIIISPNGGNPRKIPNEDSLEFEFDDVNLLSADRFPGLDRSEGGLRLNYGLRLAARSGGLGHSELFVGQSYRAQADDTFQVGTGLSRNFSDFVGRVTIAPAPYLDLSYRFRFDRKNLAVRRGSLAMSAGPEWLRGSVSYITLSDAPTTGVPSSAEQLNASAQIQISKGWDFSIVHQRDFTEDGGTLLNGVGLHYENECVDFRAALNRNFTQDLDIEPSTTFTVQVKLTHLG